MKLETNRQLFFLPLADCISAEMDKNDYTKDSFFSSLLLIYLAEMSGYQKCLSNYLHGRWRGLLLISNPNKYIVNYVQTGSIIISSDRLRIKKPERTIL